MKNFYDIPRVKDIPEVIVYDNDLNAAIKGWKTRIGKLRQLADFKERRANPTRKGRRRAKRKRADVEYLSNFV